MFSYNFCAVSHYERPPTQPTFLINIFPLIELMIKFVIGKSERNFPACQGNSLSEFKFSFVTHTSITNVKFCMLATWHLSDLLLFGCTVLLFFRLLLVFRRVSLCHTRDRDTWSVEFFGGRHWLVVSGRGALSKLFFNSQNKRISVRMRPFTR